MANRNFMRVMLILSAACSILWAGVYIVFIPSKLHDHGDIVEVESYRNSSEIEQHFTSTKAETFFSTSTTLRTSTSQAGLGGYVTIKSERGKIGNKLFQLASMYGTARRFSRTPVLRIDEPILRTIDRGALSQVKFMDHFEWMRMRWFTWQETFASSYDIESLTTALRRSDRVLMKTFMQSYKYFLGFESEFLSQIRFRKEVYDWANQYLRNSLQKFGSATSQPVIVAVHLRRGNYLDKPEQSIGYNTAPEQYYVNTTQYFVQRYPRVLFLVCSDSIAWAEQLFGNLAKTPIYSNAVFDFVKGNQMQSERDLVLLSLANHTISSVGTFSFWAAMLRQYRDGHADNATTFYYAKPFQPGSFIAKTYREKTEDFYPPEWIAVH